MKGIYAVPYGKTLVTLKSTKETFNITKPLTSVHNLVLGTMYIWTEGECVCENMITGHKAVFNLPSKGYNLWSNTDYVFDGVLQDASKNVVYKIEGKWSSHINAVNMQTKEVIDLVQKVDDIENRQEQYCLTPFGLNMNNLTPSMLSSYPPTDCRFRPDMRAYEYGDLQDGASEKQRIEEKQREKRKQMEAQNEKWKSQWFEFEIEKEEVLRCEWNGKYFKCSETREWPKDIPELYL